MALNGTRLLGLRTVELMSSTFVEEFGFGQVRPGLGFGLSVQVVPAACTGSVRADEVGGTRCDAQTSRQGSSVS